VLELDGWRGRAARQDQLRRPARACRLCLGSRRLKNATHRTANRLITCASSACGRTTGPRIRRDWSGAH